MRAAIASAFVLFAASVSTAAPRRLLYEGSVPGCQSDQKLYVNWTLPYEGGDLEVECGARVFFQWDDEDVPSGLCQLPWPGTCNRPCSDVLPGDERLPTSGKPQARRRGKRAVTFNARGTHFFSSPTNGSCEAGQWIRVDVVTPGTVEEEEED